MSFEKSSAWTVFFEKTSPVIHSAVAKNAENRYTVRNQLFPTLSAMRPEMKKEVLPCQPPTPFP
jgi:hypothetical protein